MSNGYMTTSIKQILRRIPYWSTILLGLLTSPNILAATTGESTPEGFLPHFESLITLAIVLLAGIIAWLLNHSSAKLRATGTGFSAIACIAIVVWFYFALQTGVLDNPKPFQVPMDAAKPILMWTQISIFLLAGLSLFAVAFHQTKSYDTLTLTTHNETNRYGQVSRMLHWMTAILFIFLIPTGIFSSMIPEGTWYRTQYSVVHKTIGLIVFGLFIARIIWNKKSKRPELDNSLKPKERKMAHIAHIALYLLMFFIPITGYIMTSLHGYSSWFFIWELKPFLSESEAYKFWGFLHKYLLQYLIYFILGSHILGALKHHFIDKHTKALKRMVS
ncbi:MAG: cytochrome b561 [Paraglaciecola sp.]|jgi:cytochrome b561